MLEIGFNYPLEHSSREAVDLQSTAQNTGFNSDYWESDISTSTDPNIIFIPLIALASRDTLELTIDWSKLSFQDCEYRSSSTTSITIHTKTLGDFDDSGDSKGKLDGGDIDSLLSLWNKNETIVNNISMDLAPVSGSPPHLISTPDNKWNLDDLMAFIRTWYWFQDNSARAKEKIAFTPEYGSSPQMEFDKNVLMMNFPDFDKSISRIWFQLSLPSDDRTISLPNYSQQFDIALQSGAAENVHAWNLANLGGTINIESLELVTIYKKEKELQMELQYKIHSMDGLLSSGTIMVDYKPLPEQFHLSQPYPNPFNPVTTLKFGLPVDGDVSIDIYNLQGRLIESLVSQNMKAGYHSVAWDADSHASGMYFVQMVSGEYLKTQKLMLVK